MELEWKNASDTLPDNHQEVLICVNGIYYDAVFYAVDERFVTARFKNIVFHRNKFQVFWCHLLPPGK